MRDCSTGDIGALRAEARAALDSVGDRLEVPSDASTAAPATLEAPPEPGQRVFVATFGAEGTVRSVSGRQAEVDIRGKRLRVSFESLRQAGSGPAPQASGPGAPRRAGAETRRRPGAGTESLAPDAARRELMVIGSTVDEAIDRLEKFLDAALLGDERRLRIVHGHGTGRLRDALRGYLRQHPLVESVEPAPDNEGGGGATIVELRE